MKFNLLVIRTSNPEGLKEQYELLGLEFDYHKHGNGPYHYASDKDGFVFEIYPLAKSMETADNSLRIGLEVDSLEGLFENINDTSWVIQSTITKTEWGNVGVIKDLDGRKIEVKQK